MAKGKYQQGKQYLCERCGNQIKILNSGGGNLICCVKAMQAAAKDIGDSSAAQAAAPAPVAAAPAPAKQERLPVDPAALKPIYFYDAQEFGADEAVRKTLFNDSKQSVDLICLRYAQELSVREYETDQAILLIEGRGLLTVGERQEEVSTGASLVVPAGIPYGIKNTSPDDMFVMAVCADP